MPLDSQQTQQFHYDVTEQSYLHYDFSAKSILFQYVLKLFFFHAYNLKFGFHDKNYNYL